MRERSPGATLLSRLGRRLPCPDHRVAVVVAHPDDETVGLGAQLPLLPNAVLVHVTDGAPRSGPDPAATAAVRRRELEAAARIAGIGRHRLVGPWTADQEAALHLVEVTRRLGEVLRAVDVVITHAYEGGHPDHDAVAFCAHRAARRPGGPDVIEVPLYHAGPDGWIVGRFPAPAPGPSVDVVLGPAERARKHRMLRAHASQAAVLAGFVCDVERLRIAPDHDFTRLPNGGALLYERYPWGMTGPRWLGLVRAALAEESTG